MSLSMVAVLQSSQPNPLRNNKILENVCYVTNYDLCRIPGHAAQASARFARYTWAEASHGLGGMFRYSAQILIGITYVRRQIISCVTKASA